MEWSDFFAQDIQKEHLKTIEEVLKSENNGDDELLTLPPQHMRFAAFDLCPLEKVKVCIWGQDPYHGRGEAMGLCFSVATSVKIPPSLRNIFKELHNDLNITKTDGDLTSWAEQGVLLLNSALTVREHCANSHQKYWKPITDNVIKFMSANREGIVFILWGASAQAKEKFIDTSKHFVLKAAHPSPLSANRGGFFGCKHFSKCNAILATQNVEPIEW